MYLWVYIHTDACEISPWIYIYLFFLLLACERLLKLENIQRLIIADTSVLVSDKAADPFPAPPQASCWREVNIAFNLPAAFRSYSGVWLHHIGQVERGNYCSIVQDFKPVMSHLSRFNLHFWSSASWLELWLWRYLGWASIFYILGQEFSAGLNVKVGPGVNFSDSWESISASYKIIDGKTANLFIDSAHLFWLLIGNYRNSNKLTYT